MSEKADEGGSNEPRSPRVAAWRYVLPWLIVGGFCFSMGAWGWRLSHWHFAREDRFDVHDRNKAAWEYWQKRGLHMPLYGKVQGPAQEMVWLSSSCVCWTNHEAIACPVVDGKIHLGDVNGQNVSYYCVSPAVGDF